jgi:hypothetical protein
MTLVVGAGASKALHPEFGLGIDLVNEIISRLNQPILEGRIYSKYSNKVDLDRLINALSEYKENVSNPSIDQFINEINDFPEFFDVKEDFTNILNDCIKYHILGYEGRILVSDYSKVISFESTWLHKLICWMKEIDFFGSKINFKRLKIITFNYDRTIEFFLYKYFPNNELLVSEYISESVVHIYGSIGTSLNFMPSQEKIQFGARNDDIENWQSENIRLQYDKRNFNAEIMYKCQLYINTLSKDSKIGITEKWFSDPADLQVCFMGFAFDYLNCQRLNLSAVEIKKADYFANIHPRKFDYGFNYRRETSGRLGNIRPDFNFSYIEANDFINQRLLEINPVI